MPHRNHQYQIKPSQVIYDETSPFLDPSTSVKTFAQLIKNLNNGILMEDANRKIVLVNHLFCQMMNLSLDPDRMIGMDCGAAVNSLKPLFRNSDAILQRVDELIAKRELVTGDELYMVDGKVLVRDYIPIYVENEFKGNLWKFQDITLIKQEELALHEAKEQAEESSRAKEMFLANMSHEIRTPMNAIMGMCQQLKKTLLDNQQRSWLDTIDSAAENLLVVINDILDITKIEAGKLDIEAIGFQMKDILSRATKVMQHKAEEKGIHLSWLLDGNISPVLIGDPYRLNQILLNLIGNAIKFTPKGSVSVTCSAGGPLNIGEIQCIRIAVKDTGIGMDEPFLNRLFDKFSQEDRTVTRKYGGTGLGMSICKQLVELMNGHIHVKSQKGEGTEVILTIPFLRGRECDLRQEETTAKDPVTFKGKKILLVEDNEINRLVARTVLNNYGADIREAVNGLEGVETLRREHFDLVLMDVQMPEMDGLEATRKIRLEIDPAIPIIAFTANAIKGDTDKCLAAGMNDYVSKPFEEARLIRTIACWLETPRCAPPSANPLFDLTRLNTISKGNQTFVNKMINLFLDEVPHFTEEMLTAYTSGNFDFIKKTAHRIKPTLGNLGINALKDDIQTIEDLAAGQNPSGHLLELLRRTNGVVINVAGELRTYLASAV